MALLSELLTDELTRGQHPGVPPAGLVSERRGQPTPLLSRWLGPRHPAVCSSRVFRGTAREGVREDQPVVEADGDLIGRIGGELGPGQLHAL